MYIYYIFVYFCITRDSVEKEKSGCLWLRDTACPQRSLCDTRRTQQTVFPKKRSKRGLDPRPTKWGLTSLLL